MHGVTGVVLSPLDALTLAVGARTRPAVAARTLREALEQGAADDLEQAWRVLGLPATAVGPAVALARRLHADATRDGLLTLDWRADAYPPALLTLPDPPLVVWVKGDPGVLLRPAVAIVGSRAARPGALEVARTLGAALAAQGVTVVSGLARGVDAAAHAGALEAGTTAAVLGTGIDVVYPAQHAALAARIAERGALVTEFLPGTPPLAHHFPLRNRILSGLVRAVVVVEASDRSGSLVTARLAAEQGRDVMVVPGDVRGGANKGGHALLRDGARLVESADDVLEELGWTPRATSSAAGAEPPLVGILRRHGALPVDDLVAETGRPAADLLAELLDLELGGLVTRDPSGRFLPSGGKW